MSPAKPKRKSDEILSQLAARLQQGPLDELSTAKFMRDSEAIKKVDTANALQIQAIIHRSNLEEEQCLAKFQGALNVDLSDVNIRANFGKSLMFFCRLKEARTVLGDAHNIAARSNEIARLAGGAFVSSFMFNAASRESTSNESAQKMLTIANQIHLSDQVGGAFADKVAGLFKNSNMYLDGSNATLSDDGEAIIVHYSLHGDSETVADLEFEIFELGLKERVPGFKDGRIGIICRASNASHSLNLEY